MNRLTLEPYVTKELMRCCEFGGVRRVFVFRAGRGGVRQDLDIPN